MSKQKQLGTKLETFVAKMLNGSRIAEGGVNDKGDVLFNWNGQDFYVECKARQSLNVTRELAKSINIDLPIASKVKEMEQRLMRTGLGELDVSVLHRYISNKRIDH